MITLKNKTNEQRNYDEGIYNLSNLDRDFFSLLNLNITSVEKEIDTISIDVDNVDILRDEKYKTLVLKVKVENLISFNVVSICEKETFKEYVENLEYKLSYLRNRVVLNDRERVKKMLDALNILAKDKHVKYITIDFKEETNSNNEGLINALFDRYSYPFSIFFFSPKTPLPEYTDISVGGEVLKKRDNVTIKEIKDETTNEGINLFSFLKHEYVWLFFVLIFAIINYFSFYSAQSILAFDEKSAVGWVFVIAGIFGFISLLYTSYGFLAHYPKGDKKGKVLAYLIAALINVIAYLTSLGIFYGFLSLQLFSGVTSFDIVYIISPTIVLFAIIILTIFIPKIGSAFASFFKYLIGLIGR